MSLTVDQVFDSIKAGISAEHVKSIGGVFHFKVDGKSWVVDLKNGNGSVTAGEPTGKADCTITAASTDFVNLMTGKANGQQLFMSGKIKFQGNMGLAMKLEKIPKVTSATATTSSTPSAPASSTPAATTAGDASAQAVFDELSKRIAANPSLVGAIGGIYQFNLGNSSWLVDLKNGKGSVSKGSGKADCTLTLSEPDFVGMMTGKLNSQQLFMGGKLKIAGNMGMAMKLSKLQAAKSNL